MKGDCRICKKYDDERTHLNLYVNGSEGIWVCLKCRVALTEVARSMQSLSERVEFNTRTKRN